MPDTGYKTSNLLKDNITLIATGIGIFITFATVVVIGNSAIISVEGLTNWTKQHDAYHKERKSEYDIKMGSIDEKIRGLENKASAYENIQYRLSQAEASINNSNVRTDRIVSDFNNNFSEVRKEFSAQISDMRKDLGAITTQVEIANQILRRIEAAQNSDKTGPR